MNSAAEPTHSRALDHVLRHRMAYALCGIAVVVVTSILAFGDGSDASTGAPVPPESSVSPVAALTVTSTRPREVTWPVTLKASGAIAAWEEASIGAQIGGYQLIDVRVNVGDQVKKGQVLARFDRALLLADQAQLQANADQAAANRERALTLKSSGGISDQDVLQLVTQSKTADAALAANQLRLQYTDVVAPDSGVISARTATLGAVVPVGQELFRMIRQGRIEWRAELTAEQLSQVEIGQQITLQLPDGSSASATARQVSPSLDSESRLAIVYADIHPGSRARAGMYVAGNIRLADSPALVVPARSVVIRDGRSNIVTLSDDGPTPKASLRRVDVGRRRGEEVEITRGLDRDERVVVEGAGFLADGDVVRVASPPEDAGAAQP